MQPNFFPSPLAFRGWLARHHARRSELLVGFHKRTTGRPSLTWPESVDEALCYGWIDGLRRRLDAERYCIRFTPRRPGSIWSAVNCRRVSALAAAGRMRPAGLAVFASRRHNRVGRYSYEQRPQRLPAPYARRLARRPRAHRFFLAQPPSYRRAAIWWVISARHEATRTKRLQTLIELSAAGRLIPQFTRRR